MAISSLSAYKQSEIQFIFANRMQNITLELKNGLLIILQGKHLGSTGLLYNNVPLENVAGLLGHWNMVITQESYGKVVYKRK